MLCFDVSLNGKRVCRAGLGPEGVLTSIVTWVYHTGPSDDRSQLRAKQVDLHVGGLVNDDHVAWTDMYGDLTVGDNVLVSIVEADNPDEPSRREPNFAKRAAEGIQCSFCSQPKDRQELVAGPNSYICVACVSVAVGIPRERGFDPCAAPSATA
jgi:hypothetical protein